MKLFLLLVILVSSPVWAQNLHKERIWKLSDRKRSIYFDKGIFHSPPNGAVQNLKGVRTSFIKSRGYERVVFDFSSNKPPRVYGHISKETGKLYIDFFNTKLEKNISDLQGTKYLKSLDFFNLDKEKLSAELTLSKNVSFDIFYLENPARVVVDIKM